MTIEYSYSIGEHLHINLVNHRPGVGQEVPVASFSSLLLCFQVRTFTGQHIAIVIIVMRKHSRTVVLAIE